MQSNRWQDHKLRDKCLARPPLRTILRFQSTLLRTDLCTAFLLLNATRLCVHSEVWELLGQGSRCQRWKWNSINIHENFYNPRQDPHRSNYAHKKLVIFFWHGANLKVVQLFCWSKKDGTCSSEFLAKLAYSVYIFPLVNTSVIWMLVENNCSIILYTKILPGKIAFSFT